MKSLKETRAPMFEESGQWVVHDRAFLSGLLAERSCINEC